MKLQRWPCLICSRRHFTLKRWFDCEELHETAGPCDRHSIALGIACGLSPEITHRGSSHAFVEFLLCSAATSLLIGFVLSWRSRVVVAGVASLLCWGAWCGGGFHRGPTEARGSYF